MVGDAALSVGGATSSGLRRDSAGREIREDTGEDDRQSDDRGARETGAGENNGLSEEGGRGAGRNSGQSEEGDRARTEAERERRQSEEGGRTTRAELWDNAPRKRVRFRNKSKEVVDHEGILGKEPKLHDENLADARATDEPEIVEEDVPETLTKSIIRKPSRAEVSQHEVTHLPYRSWCDLCVSGRGLSSPHKTKSPYDTAEDTRIAKVAFDWAFFRDKVGDQTLNVLVGVDLHSSARFAITASNRMSNNPKTLNQMILYLKRLGHHGNLEIQTDGEPALIELVQNLAAQRDTNVAKKSCSR